MREWAVAQGYESYIGSSVKGEACIDWGDKRERAALLSRIVGDAERMLERSRQIQGGLSEDSVERQRIVDASALLGQLLLQDVERGEEGVSLREGVSRDRIVSVHRPGDAPWSQEQQQAVRWTQGGGDSGHRLATDHRRGRIGGQCCGQHGRSELVEASEENVGVDVDETMGDAAYGDGSTRQAFADAGRTLIAKVPRRPDRPHFPKGDFKIDLESGTCTCPAGNVPGR